MQIRPGSQDIPSLRRCPLTGVAGHGGHGHDMRAHAHFSCSSKKRKSIKLKLCMENREDHTETWIWNADPGNWWEKERRKRQEVHIPQDWLKHAITPTPKVSMLSGRDPHAHLTLPNITHSPFQEVRLNQTIFVNKCIRCGYLAIGLL